MSLFYAVGCYVHVCKHIKIRLYIYILFIYIYTVYVVFIVILYINIHNMSVFRHVRGRLLEAASLEL